MTAINAFRDGLDPATLAMVDRLRALIRDAHPGLTERIKWKAPSFAIGDEDRITLGLERKGGVRMVLHRGAKPKDAAGFHFDDPDGLATWPAVDRGVIVFGHESLIECRREAIVDLCRRWIAATN